MNSFYTRNFYLLVSLLFWLELLYFFYFYYERIKSQNIEIWLDLLTLFLVSFTIFLLLLLLYTCCSRFEGQIRWFITDCSRHTEKIKFTYSMHWTQKRTKRKWNKLEKKIISENELYNKRPLISTINIFITDVPFFLLLFIYCISLYFFTVLLLTYKFILDVRMRLISFWKKRKKKKWLNKKNLHVCCNWKCTWNGFVKNDTMRNQLIGTLKKKIEVEWVKVY